MRRRGAERRALRHGIAQQDVNAYSVHDIEEVLFVQSALIQINGVSGMCLTKWHSRPPGHCMIGNN